MKKSPRYQFLKPVSCLAVSCLDNNSHTRGLALPFGNGVALSFVENRDSLFLGTNRSVTHGSMGAWWIMVNYDQAYVNNAAPHNICLKPNERRMKWSLCKKQILKMEFQEISLTAWKRLKAQLFNSQVVPSCPFILRIKKTKLNLNFAHFHQEIAIMVTMFIWRKHLFPFWLMMTLLQ